MLCEEILVAVENASIRCCGRHDGLEDSNVVLNFGRLLPNGSLVLDLTSQGFQKEYVANPPAIRSSSTG